ncbi:MAG: hypothetical protein LKG40_08895 [Lachnospiraceae bacterium]|nr:hypothetical protein [Lachnospiraceae bacterium]MCI1329195.1 hypothetical protein [Lachnospiraceae bacterium]
MPNASGKRRRRRFHFNIGVVIFGAILLYLVITLVIYLTTNRQEIYQVTTGTLSQNATYSALILREEQIVSAEQSGYVNFIVADGMKASADEAVCSVSDTQSEKSPRSLTDEDLSDIQSQASNYTGNYDRSQFDSVNDLKASINAILFGNGAADASGSVYKAPQAGLVLYSSDGYEGKTVDNLAASDFNSKSYRKTKYESDAKVESGDTLYKLITSTNWSVVIPLTDSQYEQLKDRKQVRVRFAKDGQSETGTINLFDRDGQHYCQLSFSTGVARYCGERFVNIELVTNTATGLKIPKSAVVEKDFYLIPKSYATTGGENGETGFLKEVTDDNGKTTTSFINATIYEETTPENETDPVYYYVDKSDFSAGDVIVHEDSNERYTIGDTAALQGVYCTNKGYADFRKIEVLEENDEYCIVAAGTSYGLSQYDFIVRNGKDVRESDLIRQK